MNITIYALPGLDAARFSETVGRKKRSEDFKDPIRYLVAFRQIEYHYGFSVAELQTGGRKFELVFARQLLMYVLRTYYQYSFTSIGNMLKMDHASVMYGVKKIKDYLSLANSDERIKIESFLKANHYYKNLTHGHTTTTGAK